MARQRRMRKRANGEGSIWWDEKRQRYMAQITVAGPGGKRRRRTVSARTQAEAKSRLDKLRRTVTAGPELPTEMTVSRFLTYWLDDVLPGRVKPKTLHGYTDVVRLYIDPTIGRIRLAELAPPDVDRMLARMAQRGLSPNTRRVARSVLRRALRTAEINGFVVRNVAALTDGVLVPQPKKGTLTPDEARRLLEVAEDEGEGALVAVMLGLGLRRGETLGLRWIDVRLDASRPILTVAGAYATDGRGRTTWVEAKAKSERTLHLPEALIEVLRRHRSAQAEAELAAGRGRPTFVFTNGAGNARDPDKVTRVITAIAAEAGLGHWTPHGLRHSAASILLAAGVPLKVISEMLGHSSIRITADVYGHLLEPARAEAAEAMQAAIFS
jgi:integrase